MALNLKKLVDTHKEKATEAFDKATAKAESLAHKVEAKVEAKVAQVKKFVNENKPKYADSVTKKAVGARPRLFCYV